MEKIKKNMSEYFKDSLNKYRFVTLLIFIGVVVLLAWQSDDSYHAYAMAKNLVDGNGFVYIIGEIQGKEAADKMAKTIVFRQ